MPRSWRYTVTNRENPDAAIDLGVTGSVLSVNGVTPNPSQRLQWDGNGAGDHPGPAEAHRA